MKRGLGRAKPIGNHNRSWIWGRHTVLETLRAGFWIPLEIGYSERCPAETAREIVQLASAIDVPLYELSESELTRRCRSEDHQGLAAWMPAFPYTPLADLLAGPDVPERWLVLDGVQDSFNVGAMIRSAVELGTQAILLGTAGQTGVNCQVARSSAGAVNLLPIVQVSALPVGLLTLKSRGVRIVAASEKAPTRLDQCDWSGQTAIVVGNEGRGISPEVWQLCDTHVSIPTTNLVGSLNAAVAAGICCYERWRQNSIAINTA